MKAFEITYQLASGYIGCTSIVTLPGLISSALVHERLREQGITNVTRFAVDSVNWYRGR